MPFRLTRQLENLLLPLKNAGPYRLALAAVLAALRKDPDLLLNTMDVFVNEPLVDWQVSTLNFLNSLNLENYSENSLGKYFIQTKD